MSHLIKICAVCKFSHFRLWYLKSLDGTISCVINVLTLKAPNTLIFLLLFFEDIRHEFSCESSARQRIHIKYQVIFSLIKNEKVLMNVFCYSWIQVSEEHLS